MRPASRDSEFGQRLYVLLRDQLNLPWAYSVRIVRCAKTLRRPFEYWLRRSAARKLLQGSSAYTSTISRSDGYWLFSPDELPGARAAAAACAVIFDSLQSSKFSLGERRKNRKTHFQAIFNGRDFVGQTDVIRFALSKPVIEAAAGYFGTVPVLASMTLFWSPTNDTAISSQRFHLDGEDTTQLKLFLNVRDVGHEHGPLTFFPAAATSGILAKADRRTRLNAGGTAFDDDFVLSNASGQQPFRAIGAAGSGVFVDTSRCIHFGSRGNTQERLMLMLKYVPYNAARESNSGIGSTDWIPYARHDELERLVLQH